MNANTEAVREAMSAVDRLVASGAARIDETSSSREVIGIAADGVEVQLGCLCAPADILNIGRYLAVCPSPSDW